MHRNDDGTPDFVRHIVWRRVLVVTALISLVLGTIGNYQYLAHAPAGASFGSALYHTVQLFILHSPHFEAHVPWTLEIARWLAPITILVGLAGLVGRIFRAEAEQRSLLQLADHVVVCGLGRTGMELVRHLRAQPAADAVAVVVVDKDPRRDFVTECKRLGAHVVVEDATSRRALVDAGVERAATVFAICPEDATNCEIAVQVAQLHDAGGIRELDCFVQLTTAELGQTLQQVLAARMAAGRARLHAVDPFDPAAVSLLVNELPLDHDGVTSADRRGVRLVILGLGRMGRALTVRAAQLGQFANGTRVRIDVIDRRATANRDALFFHHPRLSRAADIEFHQHEAVSPAVRDLVEGFCRDPNFRVSVVVCFDDEELALAVSLKLLPCLDSESARLAVRLASEGGLAHLVDRLRGRTSGSDGVAESIQATASEETRVLLSRLSRVKIFGSTQQLARLSNPELWPLEKLARQIHEAYVQRTLAAQGSDVSGDAPSRRKPELQQWHELSHDLRDSSRLQAAHMFIKLRAIGLEAVLDTDPRDAVTEFDLGTARMLASLEHARWNAERWVAGWEYAEKKDVARRQNPNLVPWSQLTPAMQQFDHDAVNSIPSFLAAARMKAVRSTPR